jgi:hypothetical protein
VHIRRSWNDQQYALIVPLLYSTYWLLHVSEVACHHQKASYILLSYLKYKSNGWYIIQCVVTTNRHTGHVPTRYMIHTHSICISSNSEGCRKLPDDGRLLPKHAGASIWNKGVVQSVHIVGHFYYKVPTQFQSYICFRFSQNNFIFQCFVESLIKIILKYVSKVFLIVKY